MVREEIEAVRTADPSIGKDARRTTFAAAEAEVEYTAEDFIVDEDGIVAALARRLDQAPEGREGSWRRRGCAKATR